MRTIVLAVPMLLLCAGFAQAQSDPAPPPAPDAAAKPRGGMMKAVRPACRADIKSLCTDVEPGGGRIAQCIRSHASELSAPCRDAVTRFRQSRLSGAAAPQ